MKTLCGLTVALLLFVQYSLIGQEAPPATAGPGVCISPCTNVGTYPNAQVSDDASCYTQCETTIETNPTNANNLVAAWIDYRYATGTTHFSRIGYGYSTNGGQTWINGRLTVPTSLGGSFGHEFDPSIATDTSGNFYICYCSGISSNSGGGIYVAKSTDGGITWPDNLCRRLDNDDAFDDKPLIAVDHSSNNIYIAWSHGFFEDIWFARSQNGGDTFTSPPLNLTNQTRSSQFGAMPVVGKGGRVFVVWPALNESDQSSRTLFLMRSTDGGGSFPDPAMRIDTLRAFSNGIRNLSRIFALPYMMCDTNTGSLYLTWNDRINDVPPSNFDSSVVLFKFSKDDGATWSSPLNVLNNGSRSLRTFKDQFFPWITVNPAGNRISVSYYDKSEFVNNDSCYLKVSTSIDGGKSFTPPVRISSCPTYTAVAPELGSFFGEYRSMVTSRTGSAPGLLYAIWDDTRNGNQDIFMSSSDVEIRLSGTVANNSTLSGRVSVEGDLTVPAGIKLTIAPGTYVRSGGAHTITVNGQLIAIGTPSQRITFTSTAESPQPGDWGGIVCSGGGPDTLNYCDIKYAETGIRFSNTAANSYMLNDTVAYSASSGNGVFVSSTGTANRTLRMYKCGIKNCDGKGLQVNNAKVSVSYSRIESNALQLMGSSGIYVCNGARVFFDSSRIQNNIGSGIKVSGTGSRVLLTPDSVKVGNNTVYNHGVGELYIVSSGSAFLGGGYGPGNYGGYNSVYNDATYNCRLINNTTTNTISAKWTYWGSDPNNRFCGPVDASSSLSSPVFTPARSAFLFANEVDAPPGEPVGVAPSSFSCWLKQLKSEIETDQPDAFDALHHLAVFVGPGGAYQNVLASPWEDFLSSVEQSSGLVSVRSLATALRVQGKLDQGQFGEAMTTAQGILERANLDDDLWLFMEMRRIFAAVGMNDIAGATAIYQAMLSRALTVDSEAVSAIHDYIGLSAAPGGIQIVRSDDSKAAPVPKSPILDQCYPDPFNPTTTIGYVLPEDTRVLLRIYNVLGQEVSVLVDGYQPAGYNRVTFNADRLPSGIYFYCLRAGKFNSVRKMLLLR